MNVRLKAVDIPLDHAFRRTVVLPIALALACCLSVAIGAVLWVARTQDEASVASAVSVLEHMIEARRDSLGRILVDYAAWDELFEHVQPAIDEAWMAANIGEWTFATQGVAMAFVVDADGRTTYASVRGERADGEVARYVTGGLEPILAQSQRVDPDDSLRVALVATVDGPAFAAVSTARPLSGPLDVPPQLRVSLVFVQPIDAAALATLAGVAEVDGLHVAGGPAVTNMSGLMLRQIDGAPLARLQWRADQPGTVLAWKLVPVLLALGVALTVYCWCSMRQLRRAAAALAASEARAQALALQDPLTGLANRTLFVQRLDAAIGVGAATLLYIDLDGFKDVNDTLGHGAGDSLLRTVSTRLVAAAGEGEFVARLGGDEFAVLQSGDRGVDVAEATARRILRTIAEPMRIDGQDIRVAASLGIAFAGIDGESASELGKHADIALYAAKAAGRGTYRFYDRAMDERLVARTAMLRRLRQAFDDDGLDVHFQTQHALSDNRLTGVEALVRWTDPELGPISPSEFVPLAEESGLIVPMGVWVLRRACSLAARWHGLRLGVNLSPVQFRDPNLAAEVAAVLTETGMPARRLTLEITETALFAEPAAALARIEELRGLGISIALDDFGTGYSSLSQLARFPVDSLKIDRSFIERLGGLGAADVIVRAVLSLGEGLGVDVVAEGIETEEQLALLRALRCAEGQGYHFGRPAPAHEIDRLLVGGRSRRMSLQVPRLPRPQASAI